MKATVDVYEYTGEILRNLKKGILITTKVGDKVNPMAIAWGQIGIEWQRPVFTAFVRTGRFTHQLLEQKKEFTVNIPMGSKASDIVRFCGTNSGRDHDKVHELGLTLVEGNKIDVPGIRELPLTLECKVVYSQLQDHEQLPADLKAKFYPQDVDSSHYGTNRDQHTMFMGEIASAYIAE